MSVRGAEAVGVTIGDGRSFLVRHAPLVLGMLALGVFALWYWNPHYRHDEYLVAVVRSHLSWTRLLGVIASSDPAPGPLYLLLKPWAQVSSDPWWTRIPSLVAMAVAVAATVAFARRAIDQRTAVYVGVVAILLPGMSRWAQDNRMYAPATACLTLALATWWRWVNGGSRRWAVAYGASVVGMGLFHLYTLAWIPVLVIGAAFLPDRIAAVRRTLVPAAAAAIPLAPHLYLNVLHPTGAPSNPAPSINALLEMVHPNVGILLGPLVFALVALGTVTAWRDERTRAAAVVGAAWVSLPLLLFIVARMLLHMPTLVDRYYVFIIPGLALLAGLGLRALHAWRPRSVPVVLGLALVLSLPSQLDVRAADAHSPYVYRLGRLLSQPELADLPVAVPSRAVRYIVDAATYPDQRITAAGIPPQPVAITVIRGDSPARRLRGQYLDPEGPWQPVLECAANESVVMRLVAQPGATIPGGGPEQLVATLNDRIGLDLCRPWEAAP